MTVQSKPSDNATAANMLKDIPVWDLQKHFGWSSYNDQQLKNTIEEIGKLCKAFSDAFAGQLTIKLHDSIKKYEEIDVMREKVSFYLKLNYDTDQNNSELLKFKTATEAKISKFVADYLTFFAIEMAKLSDEEVNKQMNDSLKFYESYIRNIRKLRPHLLAQDVERALTVRNSWSSADPVSQYYEKQLSLSMFDFQGEKLNMENLFAYLSKPDADVRRRALKSLNDGLKSQRLNSFAALSLNVVAGSWHIESEERGYKALRSRRNLSNNVPDEVVESLLEGVRTKGVELGRRYYLLKKKILKKTQGLEQFTWSDRNAPLALKTGEKRYSWAEAVDMVSAGYSRFSPTYAKLFHKQIDEKRVHAPALPGKTGGAYCDGVVPGIGPFQLNNFVGTSHDVATLAHESGHGVHFLLGYEQGALQWHPPLTLSECGSIFGEMVVFQDLLAKCDTDEERLAMLLEKIDSIINSVVRQCSFDRFEELVHNARRGGVIDDKDFDRMFMEATIEYYGKAGEVFDKYEDMDYLWSYVTHFHLFPFYVNSYAFADLVVGALYSVYKKEKQLQDDKSCPTKTPTNFETNLLNLLKAGSTKTFVEVLKPFGLSPEKPEFWKESLQVHLEPLLQQAEDITKKLYA